MKVLAMDLSLSSPAFAVLSVEKGVPKVEHLSHVKTNSKKSHGYRLFEIYHHMDDIYKKHPDITDVVREKGFSRFATTTQTLFKVVGLSDACAFDYGFEQVAEIAPTQVKKAISGTGKGSKDDVALGIKKYIPEELHFATDDESDAVAVGLTYLIQKKALV